MSVTKVSVVIPVYKAEPYVEKCVRTLFGQTLDNLEYIFVDDCSPDQSIEVMERILDEYPDRKPQVKVIRHEVNQGVSAARQHGVDAATGEYIIHCDPDDWVEINMYEAMFAEAKAKDADIVGCDYIEEHTNKQIKRMQDFNKPGKAIVSDIFRSEIHSSLCSRLISRRLIDSVHAEFESGVTVMEDMLYVIPLHLATEKVVYLPIPLYHYRMVDDSVTHTLTIQNINSELNVLNKLKVFIEKDTELYKAWEIAFSCRAQALITQMELYDPERWRREMAGIKIYSFSLKNRISPWLVKHQLDTINFGLICLYRLLC